MVHMYFSYPKHKSISQISQDQSNAKVLQKIIQQSNINRKKATSQTSLKIEIVECRKLFFLQTNLAEAAPLVKRSILS